MDDGRAGESEVLEVRPQVTIEIGKRKNGS